MFAIKTDIMLLFMFFQVSECQRRIVSGYPVTVDKRYVVYLVKAPIAKQDYAHWMCGGAIVSTQFVITSAACVKDVDYLYVIAGYKEYVPDYEIATNPCTKAKAKRVIYTCSPKGYELKYNELDYWSFIDIALVKVETPYNFNDNVYIELCSYKPTIIPLNYDTKYVLPGTDTMVFGWGHERTWRKPGDTGNYNSHVLRYAPTMILNKTDCIQHYDEYVNMSQVIDKYMICTMGGGNIDDKGNTVKQLDPLVNGCTRTQMKIMGFEGESCESEEDSVSEDIKDYMYYDQARRDFNRTKKVSKINNNNNNVNETEKEDLNINELYNTRRNGICQNDHGGPLITWVGSRDVLIGVASVFKVSDDSECMGPYLYTSTIQCSLFLECVLNTGELPESGKPRKPYRRDICNGPAEEKGFETIERYISWKDHPSGPAFGERHGKKDKHKHHGAQEKHHAAQENHAPYKEFADQTFTENKKFVVNERNKPNDRHTDNEKKIAIERNQGINTDHGRNLYKAFPKLAQPVNNGIAMRPLRPLRT